MLLLAALVLVGLWQFKSVVFWVGLWFSSSDLRLSCSHARELPGDQDWLLGRGQLGEKEEDALLRRAMGGRNTGQIKSETSFSSSSLPFGKCWFSLFVGLLLR